ncbi:MAG: type II secretion system protein N [Proteobacteria bacterium]|nr:type II secretion system protein N [Pseudomonadota bacterium]
MHKLVLWLLAAFVSIGFTLVAFFPASWMAALVEQQSGGRLTLGEPDGSLWRGSAFIGAAPSGSDPVTPLLPGRFNWRLSPLLLLGRVDVTLENPLTLPQAVTVQGSWSEWRIGAAALLLPAERLSSLGAPLNTIQPSGQMRLSWAPLRVARQGQVVNVYGTVTLELNDMAARLSPIKPLGAYLLDMDWQGQQAKLALKTRKGPLLLNGGGSLENEYLRFYGQAEAAQGYEDKLANLLNLLGQQRKEGNRNFIALEFRQ